jgi:hypothetical protein
MNHAIAKYSAYLKTDRFNYDSVVAQQQTFLLIINLLIKPI